MAYGYGAEILRGAGQGAKTGAGIGGTVGTIAGGQTAIGAGLGAGIGALAGGIRGAVQGRKNPERNELEELLKRQEMAALGLTDEERRIMETQLVDPLATQFRQQQALTPTQLSSGVAARMMMAQQEQQNVARAAAAQKIAQADIAERVREEEQIRKLEGSLYDQRKEDTKAAGTAALDAAGTYLGAAAFQGQVDAQKEQQARIMALGEGLTQEGVEATPAATNLVNSARESLGIVPDTLVSPDTPLPQTVLQPTIDMGAARSMASAGQELRSDVSSGLDNIFGSYLSPMNDALSLIDDGSALGRLREEQLLRARAAHPSFDSLTPEQQQQLLALY